jgi:hypothetical protein
VTLRHYGVTPGVTLRAYAVDVVKEPYTPSHEIAYCMGLIVGEGSFTGDKHQPALQVRLHDSDPEPLLDLQRVFGGTIYGPYVHGGRHYVFWKLVGWQLLEALPYVDRWLPPSRKRRQFDEWQARWRSYFARLTYVSRFSLTTGQRAGFGKAG